MENNINPEMMNNIKNLVDNGNISDAISKISPEMIESFSKMLNANSSNNTNTSNQNTSNNNISKNSSKPDNSQTTYSPNSSGFDFSSIDMNTVLKMKSAIEKMNNKNDPRANLLYSLKPYLRETKQNKLDQYVNMLNFTKIADVLKNEKKDDKNV